MPVKVSTSAKSTIVVKLKSKASPNSTMRTAVPVAQDQASEKGTHVNKDTANNKHGTIE